MAESFKNRRGQNAEQLIEKGKHNDDFVKISIEKNSALISETIRGMLFNSL
jgi:hypothetical protein